MHAQQNVKLSGWVHKVELLAAFTDRGETVTAERYFRTPYEFTASHLSQKA
jgi:hypothetical protein